MRPTAPSTSRAATALTWLSLKSATDAIFGISFSRGVVNFLAPTATKTAASSEAMIHRVTFRVRIYGVRPVRRGRWAGEGTGDRAWSTRVRPPFGWLTGSVLQAGGAGHCTELAGAVVAEGLVDLGAGVHHEGTAHRDWLADRPAAVDHCHRVCVAAPGGDRQG